MDIATRRLIAQGIQTPLTDNVSAIVSRLGAMQAQDYAGGLWSLGLRMKQPSITAVEKAISNADIVRTWPMRGTLHFVAAKDIHWMLKVLAGRATAAARNRRIDQLGLTDAIVDQAEAVLRTELAGGKRILRGDVTDLLARKVTGIKIDNQHTQHLMRNFGERGIICFGPHEGKQPTFVLLNDWIKPTGEKTREEALGELAYRYFLGHGPALLSDFAGWGYLKLSDARTGLHLALPKLAEEVIGGKTYYFDRDSSTLEFQPSAFLLPGFDEFILGYKDRSAMLAAEHRPKIVPGNNGMFIATIIVDGHVVGTWKRKLKKAGVSIDIQPFDDLSKQYETILRRSVERYGTFLGLPATID